MRLWVTGASGFVASHLIPALISDGHEITGLGLNEAGPPWLGPGRYRALDVSSSSAVAGAAAADRPDAVVHLAGQSSAGQSFQAVEETFQQNLGSALGLLEGLRRSAPAARALMVSTSEVYGPQPSAAPASEDTPLKVASPYGASKLAAEVIAETYHREHGMDVVRVRPFSHTGPRQDSRFALSSFAEQIARLERGGKPGKLMVGNLEVVRDYMDVRDVVDAYRVILARGERGSVYNIASGRGHRMRDLLDHLVGRSRVRLEVEPDASRLRPNDLNFMVGDASRLRALGWSAGHAITEALDLLLEWRRSELDS